MMSIFVIVSLLATLVMWLAVWRKRRARHRAYRAYGMKYTLLSERLFSLSYYILLSSDFFYCMCKKDMPPMFGSGCAIVRASLYIPDFLQAAIFIIPLTVWLVVELISAVLLDMEFAGGGLK